MIEMSRVTLTHSVTSRAIRNLHFRVNARVLSPKKRPTRAKHPRTTRDGV
jgi:hypothetical protein